MKQKIFNLTFNIFIVFLTIIVFINPDLVSSYFLENLMFIIKIIIPSLFPFMIFVNFILLSNSIDYLAKFLRPIGKFFNLSGYGVSCLISSILGGFPYSSIIVNNFVKSNKINNEEANRIINYCQFPSISFLFVGLLKIDHKFLYIIISIYLSSFILLLISHKNTTSNNCDKIKIIINNDIPLLYNEVINSTVKSIISISFSILFFSTLSSLLTLIIYNERIIYYISGILEFSNSSINILMFEKKTFIDYLVINIIISFTSLSIIFQSMTFLKDINIKIKQLLIHRLIIVLLSSLIFSFLYFI